MEPALDIIHRALQGDSGARAFLERTTSIYVLDVATDPSQPKTYGCWNFLHQAMNEVERFESRFLLKASASTGSLSSLLSPSTPLSPPLGIARSNSMSDHDHPNPSAAPSALIPHVRMIASMALRVGRRSPLTDRALVRTCLSNATSTSQVDGSSPLQQPWLLDVNQELREIVMGRIAAMAFDFSFHRKRVASDPDLYGHTLMNGAGALLISAFADSVVMDSFCATLSANGVSSGPSAIQHLVREWIIPSSRNLPPYAVASVVLHFAREGMRISAPAGTKMVLQQLSAPIMSVVLFPTLIEAMGEDTKTGPFEPPFSIITACLRAVKAWCEATDLSLPQIKHICSKVHVNVVDILSDAMYSDSHEVIDALAELIEFTVHIDDEVVMSQGRMDQLRYMMNVDEVTFHERFSSEQLKTIESKELESIVDDLMSAIALQRFRFSERQNLGDQDVCRNLTRIAASLCATAMDVTSVQGLPQLEAGAVNLLSKASGHPSVATSAIALEVFCRVFVHQPSYAHEVLPILQRRAIIPHVFREQSIALRTMELGGVNSEEFENFRETVLSEALLICWQINGERYMDSCSCAVAEFCGAQASVGSSLHLEAALFCIEQTASDALVRLGQHPQMKQLNSVIVAIASKPPSLMANSLTRARACSLLRKVLRWCMQDGTVEIVQGLALSLVDVSITASSVEVLSDDSREHPVSSVSESILALKELCCRCPLMLANENGLEALSDLWKSTCAAGEHVGLDDRLRLCRGICRIIAALPDGLLRSSFDAIGRQTLERLDQQANLLKQSRNADAALARLADEIQVLSALSVGFARATCSLSDGMESGCGTAPDRPTPLPEAVLEMIKRAWPTIKSCAANYADDERMTSALTAILTELLPTDFGDANSVSILRECCSIVSIVVEVASDSIVHFDIVFSFLSAYVKRCGEAIERVAMSKPDSPSMRESERDINRLLDDILLRTLNGVKKSLGTVWSRPSEQAQGQPASESSPSTSKKLPNSTVTSNHCLAKMMIFLTSCVNTCPIYLLRFPSSRDMDRDVDVLIRRAVDSASSGLHDGDNEIAKESIGFLTALCKNASTRIEDWQAFVGETMARLRTVSIHRLLCGCCGWYDFTMMEPIAQLLFLLLLDRPWSETEPELVASLQQAYFGLGDPAKSATLLFLRECAQGRQTVEGLTVFLERIWELHHVAEIDVMPASDAVAFFLRKYPAS